jgi:hypothetical protein
MQSVIPKRDTSLRASHPVAASNSAQATRGDPTPCPNPACRAPGWPLVAKPLNWPWAEQCWNCNVELRRT